jgi:ankyrin repeat protein
MKSAYASGTSVESYINSTNNSLKNTPLHWAAGGGHYDCCAYIIQCGGKLNTQNHEKETPLMLASSRGKDTVCKLLLQKGADKNVKNKDGKTAVDLARDGSCRNIIRNFDPNAPEEDWGADDDDDK